jgi:hypothetical protein
MAFSQITITGTWKEADGTTPARGRVVLQLSRALQDSSTNTIRAAYREVVPLNANGAISKVVVANDDVTSTPTGTSYHVREEIVGAAVREYDVVIPAAAPGATIDLADLVHVTPARAALGVLTGLGHGLYWAEDNGFVVGDSTAAAANATAWDAFWALSNIVVTTNSIIYTDATAGIRPAQPVGVATGGAILVFGPGDWWFTDLATRIPPYCGVKGQGMYLTTLRITTPTGKLRGPNPAVSTSSIGGYIGKLTLDGRDSSDVAQATTLLEVGWCSQWTIESVHFVGKATNAVSTYGTAVTSATTQEAALVMRGTQNTQVRGCFFDNIAGTAVLMDDGCGTCLLDQCFWSGCTEDLRSGTNIGGPGTLAGTSACMVSRGILERDTYAHDKVFSVVLQVWDQLVFQDCSFSLSQCPMNHAIAGARRTMVVCASNENALLTLQRVTFRDCIWQGTLLHTGMVYATTNVLSNPDGSFGHGFVIQIIFQGLNQPSAMLDGVVINAVQDVLITDQSFVNLAGVTNPLSTITASAGAPTAGGWNTVANGWRTYARTYLGGGAVLVGPRNSGTSMNPTAFGGYYTYPGNPNGNVTALAGSICIDTTNGVGYFNSSAAGTTGSGWTLWAQP